jgi:molybdenum cofactor cytidylyltransferase
MKIAALVLAAGLGTRMGGAKMAVEWNGRPLPVWPVMAAIEAGCDPVVAVVGPDRGEWDLALLAAGARVVVNPHPGNGQASSLACGLAAIGAADWLFVLLGDMPLVGPHHLRALIAALDGADGRTIAAPVFQGRRGNPVLFDQSHFAALATLTGDQGARGLIGGAHTILVPMADRAVLTDIDTPDDLGALIGEMLPKRV